MDIWSLKEPPRYQNSHIRIKELLIANPTVFDRTAYDFLERIRLIVEIFNGSPPVQEIQTRVGNNCDYSPEKPSGTYSNNKEEYSPGKQCKRFSSESISQTGCDRCYSRGHRN